jgi:hypothetical protein
MQMRQRLTLLATKLFPDPFARLDLDKKQLIRFCLPRTRYALVCRPIIYAARNRCRQEAPRNKKDANAKAFLKSANVKSANFPLKVNVGCGNEPFQGWINLDLSPETRADILWDATDGLPSPTIPVHSYTANTSWSISRSKRGFGFLLNAVGLFSQAESFE